ncbi:diphthamide synthesis protein 1, putative [Bodo saltans]|uniref:2-(3-amino-3-carboxypropyl)histidine synthase subunit 1 n=1 Tax=Bodo saltans TaxID=75058 RepID=A0A0S4JS33_BODSA|nr:diphthamide synthesis protein 1, putative [Bodo saltans]|eukprot:CUG93018.1 diphthamide synthesis protein 1, putative [Bodo saltans]
MSVVATISSPQPNGATIVEEMNRDSAGSGSSNAQQQDEERKHASKLGLPANYHFEIDKTIKRIKEKKATRVALQFPEGLLMFSAPIADLLEEETGAEMVILGDVTYGACCVDDYAATALGCDFLVHYGHSCLISIKDCTLPNMMYVFVEIDIDVTHFVDTVKSLVPSHTKVCCIATIQFVSSLRGAVGLLQQHFSHPIHVPQNRPLSSGELLGCTSPKVDAALGIETVLYIGDGRFHLESFMIHNPAIQALQYNPYEKKLTKEGYAHQEMHTLRQSAIADAKAAGSVGIVMGTLGRQGNPKLVDRLTALAEQQGKSVVTFLMSEIFPAKLAAIPDVDAFIQVACPRLSIDWGYAFDRPLLNPYEAEVALGSTTWQSTYPMDHYSKSGGKWAVYTDKSL